jgi:N-acylneuraminate cytidylyltransferase
MTCDPTAAALPDPLEAVVFDFDGVFTDNRVWVSQDGTEMVACNRSDGMGIDFLRDSGLPVLVLSKEKNPVVRARCAKLRIPCLNGIDDKRPALERWAQEQGVDLRQTVFVGNDVNDLPCLEAVGCGVVVADAHPDVIPAARIVLSKPGGHGAVREIADLIVRHRLRGAS